MTQQILLTGDYWHPDFRLLIPGFRQPVTLVAFDRLADISPAGITLIIIAVSRREQFDLSSVETIQAKFANTPVVALVGSWCEGEPRSGTPWPGVTRVYWHQWLGRFESFSHQLQSTGITDWHLPPTTTVADRARARLARESQSHSDRLVGISAWTPTQYEMLADAAEHFGWRHCWVERAVWDADAGDALSVICVDADSWTPELNNRVKWLRSEFPVTPLIMLLNYPRASELDEILVAGVCSIVSKPFELDDLSSAINRAARQLRCLGEPSGCDGSTHVVSRKP